MGEAVNINQIKTIGDLVLQNKVIPIIGYELLWVRSKKNRSEFIRHLIKNLDASMFKENLYDEFQNRFPNAPTSEVINFIYHSLKDRKQKGNFNYEFSKAINKARAELPIFWEPFIKLALIKNFRLYINVTCTNVLEIAINAFRAKSQEDYEVYGPLKSEKRDLPSPKVNLFEKPYALTGIAKTSIYNLFGTYNTDSKYLLTDVEYVDLLVEFLQKDCFCQNFQRYLQNASLLFIGCSFPDWFLRFFTRFWAGSEMDSKLADQYNILIDSFNDPDISERSFFISNYKITALSGSTTDFIDSLFDHIQKPNSKALFNSFRPKALHNYVLISYNSLDKEIANALERILTENHVHVWLDEQELNKGSVLDETISNVISRCCLVLQIVSPSISKRTDADPYFLREWQLIINQNVKRIPIIVDDVNSSIMLPNHLQKYRSVVQETMTSDMLSIRINSNDIKLDDSDIAWIHSRQYKVSIKDMLYEVEV